MQYIKWSDFNVLDGKGDLASDPTMWEHVMHSEKDAARW